ncbi:Pre-rRNA-processing protein IPI3 [Vanrija pseudolonga]|uniref:Pre-rRNA-processing protein IPI3 n=1 Tax=Vanrija pseudolonga TaxID=143232 RepID=A0AAF1BMJ3_9TREE|nr:Pre-rRNA-processing protein IPI3 [Vanrija pseudolonga]
MATQELVLSASSASGSSSSRSGGSTSTPAIHLHDLATSSHVQAFKTSSNGPNSLATVRSQDGVGGTVWAIQEGKAIAGVWAWQKDQQHLKLHLPERLTCFSISPNGLWAAGGSPNGQVYVWEIASGALQASWTAHYRTVNSLTFTPDSALLISSSADASVHVFVVAHLLDPDTPGTYSQPYGTLGDHTLAITAVAVGRTANANGGRCWTAAEDGTVKMWSLSPPFDLLATFSLPSAAKPTSLVVDSAERFVYVGSGEGNVYLIPLFKRKGAVGGAEAIEGDGLGAPSIKADLACLTVESPVTCLALSHGESQLLVGTRSGEIHIHSLPSHQQLRTITAHSGPITHLSTLVRPADLSNSASRNDPWPIMEIRNLERTRVNVSSKHAQTVGISLRPSIGSSRLDRLRRASPQAQLVSAQHVTNQGEDNSAALSQEVRELRAALDRAVKLNEKMWNGVVDLKLA